MKDPGRRVTVTELKVEDSMLVALKTEEGTTSQGRQVASGDWQIEKTLP